LGSLGLSKGNNSSSNPNLAVAVDADSRKQQQQQHSGGGNNSTGAAAAVDDSSPSQSDSSDYSSIGRQQAEAAERNPSLWLATRCLHSFLHRPDHQMTFAPAVYYFATVFNATLRFAWLWLPLVAGTGNPRLVWLLAEVLELVRRFHWCIFRIEWEVHNVAARKEADRMQGMLEMAEVEPLMSGHNNEDGGEGIMGTVGDNDSYSIDIGAADSIKFTPKVTPPTTPSKSSHLMMVRQRSGDQAAEQH
jgi:hypothetical protein